MNDKKPSPPIIDKIATAITVVVEVGIGAVLLALIWKILLFILGL